MEKEELKTLFKKYREGECTEEEKTLLETWYLQLNEQDLDISPKRIQKIRDKIYRKLPGNHTAIIYIGNKLALAAIVIGALLTLTLKFFLPQTHPATFAVKDDIKPGKNSAVLTLSNGTKVDLTKAVNGALAIQTGIQILKTADGQILYKVIGKSGNTDNLKLNTISTPRGGQWQVILPDGSKVWLNSASTLNYPATFEKRNERIVQLSGEAYFEVSKDKLHPFIVKTDKQAVKVLGTHFDIYSYPDERSAKTTLSEGRIQITNKTGETKILSPGEQAILNENHLIIGPAEIEEALAWKNGYFRFNDESIQSIMHKLSRWYDIEVTYDGDKSSAGLNGKISRYKNISQVLKALEATKTVHFKVEGRRVVVMQ